MPEEKTTSLINKDAYIGEVLDYFATYYLTLRKQMGEGEAPVLEVGIEACVGWVKSGLLAKHVYYQETFPAVCEHVEAHLEGIKQLDPGAPLGQAIIEAIAAWNKHQRSHPVSISADYKSLTFAQPSNYRKPSKKTLRNYVGASVCVKPNGHAAILGGLVDTESGSYASFAEPSNSDDDSYRSKRPRSEPDSASDTASPGCRSRRLNGEGVEPRGEVPAELAITMGIWEKGEGKGSQRTTRHAEETAKQPSAVPTVASPTDKAVELMLFPDYTSVICLLPKPRPRLVPGTLFYTDGQNCWLPVQVPTELADIVSYEASQNIPLPASMFPCL